MVVYLEYAFAENFLLDGLLLYLSVRCARGRVRAFNLILAAAAGGAEAIVFPLLDLPSACAYPVKITGGVLLVVLAVSGKRPKTYAVACAAFFFFTFALGGLLTAAYSFFGVAYAEGGGYLVEGAPVALVFALAGIFAVAVVSALKAFYRYRKVQSNLFPCALFYGDRRVEWKGFADSGNCLMFRGSPVCVISAAAAFALFGRDLREVGRLNVGTVNGSREVPVLQCDGIEISHGGKKVRRENVYLAVAGVDSKDYQIILHTALTEECNETFNSVESMAEKYRGK